MECLPPPPPHLISSAIYYFVDTTHGLKPFPQLTMQVKTASCETTPTPQPVPTDDALRKPQRTTKRITAFADQPSEWNTTGAVTPVEIFTQEATLLVSHSISTIFDKKVAVRVTKTTESSSSIKRNTQIADLSVVTPEQSKYIKPVDMAILSMIPESNSDLTTYSNQLLRRNKPEQQNITFWPTTPQNPGKMRITP